jgi:hypothetical protein
MRNILGDLDNLPDKPRVGINLIVGGLAILAVRYVWPLVGLASFQRAGAVVYHAYAVMHRYLLARRASPEDLNDYLVGAALLCLIFGAFIFFLRGFWWWSERRNEKEIIQLKLK